MKEIIEKAANDVALSEEETYTLFEAILAGGEAVISDENIRAYLLATSKRPITADELVGAARSMRRHVTSVVPKTDTPLLDTCGTGGSGIDSFSTSTTSAFVVAGAGQAVAKHGNRAASSRTGSADVLEALGVKLDVSPEIIADCIERAGFGFMFAPGHHPATKRVMGIRRELGVRTIFNFLGPLVNPAGATYQVLGVSRRDMVPVMAEALMRLGGKRAMVAHGCDGLDEITLTDASEVAEVKDGRVECYQVKPEDFGLKRVTLADIPGAEAAEMAEHVRQLLAGKRSAYRDLVLLNAGAALYISGKAATLGEGVQLAGSTIDDSKAREVLERVVAITNQ